MKTLEQIKNDYSVSEKYTDFEDLLNGFLIHKDTETMNKHLKNLLEIYAMECLKLASENAEADHHPIHIEWVPVVNKQSITNENNIIK